MLPTCREEKFIKYERLDKMAIETFGIVEKMRSVPWEEVYEFVDSMCFVMNTLRDQSPKGEGCIVERKRRTMVVVELASYG